MTTEHKPHSRRILDATMEVGGEWWVSLGDYERLEEQLEAARWQAEALGAHNFSGRHDRDCVLCGKPDRHPFHGTMMRPSNPASEPKEVA